MPRDVNVYYTLAAGKPVIANTVISSVWGNTTMTDIGTALTNSLDRTGVSSGMTGKFKAAAGAIGAPGISWQLETTSGLYRAGSGAFRFSVSSTDVIKITGAGVTIAAPSSGDTLTILSLTTNKSIIAGILGAANNPRLFVTHTEASGLTQLDFTGSSNFNGALSVGGVAAISLSNARNVTIAAPGSGDALTVNGVSSSRAATFQGGTNPNIAVTDGTIVAKLQIIAASVGLVGTETNHEFDIRTNNATRVALSGTGNVTINTPASGTALTVNGIANANSVVVTDGTRSFAIQTGSGSGGVLYFGSFSNHPLNFLTNNTVVGSINTAGNWAINAPSSGTSLSISQVSGGQGIAVNGAGSSSASTTRGYIALNGPSDCILELQVGAVNQGYLYASSTVFRVAASAGANLDIFTNNAQLMHLTSNAVQCIGPVAAALVDMTPDSGSFSAVLTGFTANPTSTVTWKRVGGMVTLHFGSASATSNATTMGVAAATLPASIRPTTTVNTIIPTMDSGVVGPGLMAVNTDGSLTFGKTVASTGLFTASGTKGINGDWAVSYSLN